MQLDCKSTRTMSEAARYGRQYGDPGATAAARGMAGLVADGEVGAVVDVRVQEPQGDEPPIHAVVTLRTDHPHPLAGHPGERAERVKVEVETASDMVGEVPVSYDAACSRT
jgi:hypothetical protein